MSWIKKRRSEIYYRRAKTEGYRSRAVYKLKQIVGTVESVKSAEDFYSPVTGKVVEVNKTLEKTPEEINKNPYDAWIVKLKISNPAEVNNLMKKDAYEKIIK